MRYPLNAGGKRIRPILVLIGMDFCNGISAEDAYSGKSRDDVSPELKTAVLKVSCAIEMVHTYSLVHDDLPCMDDDDLRRGRPTSHKVYGEAMAVLSADALHTLGFQLIASLPDRFAYQAMRAAGNWQSPAAIPVWLPGRWLTRSMKINPEIWKYWSIFISIKRLP